MPLKVKWSITILISYIKMKVCMCVCVCVCPAACRLTHTTNHPKIWRGLLISPWLGTEPGGDPKCLPRGTSHTDPVWNSLKGKQLGGGQQTKVAPWGGFATWNFICGGLTQTWGPQDTPYQMRVYALRIGRGPANKSCSSGWICIHKFHLWGGSPQPKPRRVLRSFCTGLFHNENSPGGPS